MKPRRESHSVHMASEGDHQYSKKLRGQSRRIKPIRSVGQAATKGVIGVEKFPQLRRENVLVLEGNHER